MNTSKFVEKNVERFILKDWFERIDYLIFQVIW